MGLAWTEICTKNDSYLRQPLSYHHFKAIELDYGAVCVWVVYGYEASICQLGS